MTERERNQINQLCILPSTEAEKRAFNKTVSIYRHKYGFGGQRAFKFALTSWKIGKAFQSLGLASLTVTETFERLGNALKGQIVTIKSEMKEIDGNGERG